MKIRFSGLMVILMVFSPSVTLAVEVTGTGSMIPGPLIKVWADAYSMRSTGSVIKYKGSNPADGIKRLVNKEVDFSSIDMPLNISELNKNGLLQFPFALGAIVPMVNLPKVYPGQLRMDGPLLADILLGNIKKWNDPALVALNPKLQLPDAEIIVIRRASPPGISKILGRVLYFNR